MTFTVAAADGVRPLDRLHLPMTFRDDLGARAPGLDLGDPIQNNDSATSPQAVRIWMTYVGLTPTITMSDQSRIRDNHVANGYAALTFWPDCGSPTTATGTDGRVVNNSPANQLTATGCEI
ncbi:MAG: hypothetical protein U0869_19725 [Chloroflexota bacterium]